jgi:hypothetical protein
MNDGEVPRFQPTPTPEIDARFFFYEAKRLRTMANDLCEKALTLETEDRVFDWIAVANYAQAVADHDSVMPPLVGVERLMHEKGLGLDEAAELVADE